MNNLVFYRGLVCSTKCLGGRTSRGSQAFFHKGGRAKRSYRIVDYFRMLKNIPAIVRSIEYVPGRNTPLALLVYTNEIMSFIVAPKNLGVGQIIYSCEDLSFDSTYYFQQGSAHYLAKFPIGSFIFNLGLAGQLQKGAQLMRSFNSSAQILRKYPTSAILKLKSGEHRRFSNNTIVTLGVPDGEVLRISALRKAGVSRRLGRRPVVRGCAMNPIDHPQGGGAAKSSGKRGALSPWGKFSKGTKTTKYKVRSKNIIKLRYAK